MKIVLIGSALSIHIVRWANSLALRGNDVIIITQHEVSELISEDVHVIRLKFNGVGGYIFNILEINELLKEIRPDIINAHYATGYGFLARFFSKCPKIISVWGSDIFDFPRKSLLHRLFIMSNLKHYDAIASTSNIMAKETKKYNNRKRIYVTPFGIDINKFKPRISKPYGEEIIIGTVKTLEFKYGIDLLIKAFKYCVESDSKPVKLIIYGAGSQKDELEYLINSLKLNKKVELRGKISHDFVPEALREFDIFASLSRLDSESFGVAVLEAASVCLPVVVSDASGLAEVTANGLTGFIVPKEDWLAAAHALLKLIDDRDLREAMGRAGRRHVIETYSWEDSVDTMILAYKDTIERKNRDFAK